MDRREVGGVNVKGLVWMGVQTERFDEMLAFLEVLFGRSPQRRDAGFALWSLPNGDIVELYAQGGKPDFGTAPVVGFQVPDLDAARRELERAGAVVVGGYGPNEDGYATVHFRAPDGNVYELTYDPQHEQRGTLTNGEEPSR